jgi:hypothetical protein
MSLNCNSRGPSERDCAGIGDIKGPCTWYNQGYGCSCPNKVMFKSDSEDREEVVLSKESE